MQSLQRWPKEANYKEFSLPALPHRLTKAQALRIARKHALVRRIFKEHPGVREFAWFQGFCWTISYYTDDWGALAIVFVDDETGEIADLLQTPGDLEEQGEGTDD